MKNGKSVMKKVFIAAAACLLMAVIAAAAMKEISDHRFQQAQAAYLSFQQEDMSEAEEIVTTPQILPEDMYGSWELVNEPYNITFTKEHSFAIHYFNELGNKIEALYAGKWEITDGDKLVLYATEKGGLNIKFQEIWNYLDSAIHLEFTYISKNEENVYSFAGSSSTPETYLQFLGMKKMLTEEEFKEKADNKLKDTLEYLYGKEGNYGIEILSSTWKREDTRFAQGECSVRITDLTNSITEEMSVDIWFMLERMQNLGHTYSLRISRTDSSKYESALIYSYDNLKGMSQRTDKELLLPKK